MEDVELPANFSCWNISGCPSVHRWKQSLELNYGFACDVSLGHKPLCWVGKLSLSVT